MKKHTFLLSLILVANVLIGQTNNAQFISQTVPTNILPGAQFNISITLENTGGTTWSESTLYRLGSQSPTDNTDWGTNRITLPNDVAPTEQVTITATLTAPTNQGLYNFQWRMLQDGVAWFGEQTELIYFPMLSPIADTLLTNSDEFSVSSHVVATSFFSWYGATEGQQVGPWIPINGRETWTGDIDFWKRMIKQTMYANIDVFYVELIPFMEDKRGNLFVALNQLRQEGWDVPKICPFLDPLITYDIAGQNGDCSTEAGKDEFVSHYIRFYEQYYAINTDQYADDYIYTQDGHPVLNIWHIYVSGQDLGIYHSDQLSRSDITNRLSAEFGTEHPIFNNDIRMINNAISEPHFTFADERVHQFEVHEYNISKLYNGIKSVQVKPGYWDQNVRNPGYLLPRNGGSHYTTAWNQVNADASINRIYIESFNEYDEGSGIYAAKTDTIYKKTDGGMNNTGNDVWSSTNDPYEYIKTTALGAAQFNDDKQLNAKILWDNIPSTMLPNETFIATIVLRNEGNQQWNAANDFKFGEMESLDATMFGIGRYLMNDSEDEIPIYEGVFRGRAKTFNIEIVAPSILGTYTTHWGMLQEGIAWFGDTLIKQIIVDESTSIDKLTNNTFSIYPNPASDNLQISVNNETENLVTIFDITGKIVKQFRNKDANFTIKLDDLDKGVYFLNIEMETKKFIKE